jgi:hypothetical protein
MPLKYTFKKTGTVLQVFESRRVRRSREIEEHFMEHAKMVAEEMHGDTAGFCIVAWDYNGCNAMSIHTEDDCKLSYRLLPDWLRERARAKLTTHGSAVPPEYEDDEETDPA